MFNLKHRKCCIDIRHIFYAVSGLYIRYYAEHSRMRFQILYVRYIQKYGAYRIGISYHLFINLNRDFFIRKVQFLGKKSFQFDTENIYLKPIHMPIIFRSASINSI